MSTELKEFISDALAAICDGVNAAREKSEQIAPLRHSHANSGGNAVEFDLAVTTTESESDTKGAGTKKKFGISVLRAEVGFESDKSNEGSKEQNRSTVSRIRFSVPVYLQYAKHLEDESDAQIRSLNTNRRPRADF